MSCIGNVGVNCSTYPAHKAIGMPLRVQCRNIVLHNGTIAAIAFGCKHFEIVGTTIGFTIALVETIFAKLLATLSAKEMLRMPGFIQCRYAFIQNGAITVRATWTKQIMIVGLAIWKTVAFKEITCTQFLATMIAGEMLRMPCLAQRGNHLTNNRFLACIAAALLHRIDTLTTHIGL